jgi:hypothetical protein
MSDRRHLIRPQVIAESDRRPQEIDMEPFHTEILDPWKACDEYLKEETGQ